ncbi:hypothetical protein LKMONMHP_4099 [Methylobacterium organophilum]|uniref:Chemotaxis protein CheZ n=2 Tax=Methylobacterium organophilum TaxID=410 RepID=A0ABQ4TC07_METOR|nr:hypothetical protein LKMONMHP_4099 [Methylobacterium organophilum]
MRALRPVPTGPKRVVFMSSSRSLTPLDASEYDLIEAAVRETARGRWFLSEFARRNRNADTDLLLNAIGRLENAVTSDRTGEGVGRLRGDLMDMADAIARTKVEITALNAPERDQSRLTMASEALDAIVRDTERATSDILGAAENVQEAAWTLRETGADAGVCDELDRRATQIYTACSFQDLTAQRTGRIVHTLRYLEERIASMIAIWGEPIEPAPSAHESRTTPTTFDLSQSDVDRFIDMEPNAEAPTPKAPLPATSALADDLVFLPEVPEAAEIAPVAPVAALALVTEDFVPEEDLAEEGRVEQAAVETAEMPESPEAALADAASDPELEDEPVLLAIEPETPPPATEPELVVPSDDVEAFDAEVEAAPAEAETKAEAELGEVDLSAVFGDLDSLTIEEKIALFS